MYPRIRLGDALVAIKDQECQWVIMIVAGLSQQRSSSVALHGNQGKRWVALMMLPPPCPAAAEVAHPIKNNYSAFSFQGSFACALCACPGGIGGSPASTNLKGFS